MGDHELVGLRIVALETLVTVLKAQVDALLGVPPTLFSLVLLDVDVGAATKDAEHTEVGLLAKESLVGCDVL